jgi:O-Antigen ligase
MGPLWRDSAVTRRTATNALRRLPVWTAEGGGGVRAGSSTLSDQAPKALQWALILLVSLFIAMTVSGRADVWLGHTTALLALALVLSAAAAAILAGLGALPLLVWAPVAVAAYPLVRFPRDHPILTFDRLWITGLLAYILLGHRRMLAAPMSRFLKFGLFGFAAVYGIRAIATRTSLSGPIQTWFDSIVLPSIILVAASRYSVSRERSQRLAASLMIAGGLLGAVGLAERIFGFELASLSGGQRRYDDVVATTRVSGVYAVPETYALGLIICLAATLYWVQTKRRGAYLWGALFVALELGGIAFTYFRAAWIGALLVIIGSFGIRPHRFARLFAVTLVVGGVAFAATAQLEHNQKLAERTTNTDNIYGRLATYQEGIHLFKSKPLAGIGVDQYSTVVQERPSFYFHGVRSVDFPHSSFIAVLAEQGLLGFVPLMVLGLGIWLLIRRLRSASTSDEEGVLAGSLAGAAGGYLIMSLTLTMLPYEPSNAFFAAFLGLAVGRLDVLSSRRGGALNKRS